MMKNTETSPHFRLSGVKTKPHELLTFFALLVATSSFFYYVYSEHQSFSNPFIAQVAQAATTWHVNNTIACNDTNPGTAAQPLCTLQGADSRAIAGDTIIVDAGTYTDTGYVEGSSVFSIPSSWGWRITKANTIWQVTTPGSVIIDGGNVRHGGVWITVPGVLLSGFSFQNQAWSSVAGARIGAITVGDASAHSVLGANITLSNNTITVTERANDLDSGTYGIRYAAQNITIANNSITGGFPVGIYGFAFSLPNSGVTSIHDNTLTNNRSQNAATGFTWEPQGVGAGHRTLIYKNSYKRTSADFGNGRCMYLRDFDNIVYVWDNFCSGSDRNIYFQDDAAQGNNTEQAYIFNNTFLGDAFGGQFGIVWQQWFHADVRNNVFKNFTGAAVSFTAGGATTGAVDAADTFSSNDYEGTPLLKQNSGFPEPTMTGNTNTSCALDPSTQKMTATSGGCYDNGTSNPVDQGANTCSVSGVSCITDIDGQTRPQGALWDIGYDEYVASGPAVCGNNIRETGEACDGFDFGGETCASQGFGGGTLACTASCRFDTTFCAPGTPATVIIPDQAATAVTDLRPVDVNGNSIASSWEVAGKNVLAIKVMAQPGALRSFEAVYTSPTLRQIFYTKGNARGWACSHTYTPGWNQIDCPDNNNDWYSDCDPTVPATGWETPYSFANSAFAQCNAAYANEVGADAQWIWGPTCSQDVLYCRLEYGGSSTPSNAPAADYVTPGTYTYTVTENSRINLEMMGGGGRGDFGCAGSSQNGGRGGSAGTYFNKVILLTPGSYTVTVGNQEQPSTFAATGKPTLTAPGGTHFGDNSAGTSACNHASMDGQNSIWGTGGLGCGACTGGNGRPGGCNATGFGAGGGGGAPNIGSGQSNPGDGSGGRVRITPA